MILQADAFALPFKDGTFDVVVADPPYEVSNPQSKRLIRPTSKQGRSGRKRLAEVGYIEFVGRTWWREAWRALSPDGHLYVFAVIKELPAWFRAVDLPQFDVIAWVQPNARGVQSMIRRVIGGRTLAWRPILHWRKGRLLSWKRPDGRTEYVEPNYFIESQVQSNMIEALPWPNQLPLALMRWLLRPHRGARILDLFSGTGTTREAAFNVGLDVVSVDASPQAIAIIAGRPMQPPLHPELLWRADHHDQSLLELEP